MDHIYQQDAEVFMDNEFVGEVLFIEDCKIITICTPQADYEFTLTKITEK